MQSISPEKVFRQKFFRKENIFVVFGKFAKDLRLHGQHFALGFPKLHSSRPEKLLDPGKDILHKKISTMSQHWKMTVFRQKLVGRFVITTFHVFERTFGGKNFFWKIPSFHLFWIPSWQFSASVEHFPARVPKLHSSELYEQFGEKFFTQKTLFDHICTVRKYFPPFKGMFLAGRPKLPSTRPENPSEKKIYFDKSVYILHFFRSWSGQFLGSCQEFLVEVLRIPFQVTRGTSCRKISLFFFNSRTLSE